MPDRSRGGDLLRRFALKSQVQALMNQNQGQVGGDQNVEVNCTPTDTIGAALAKAGPGGRLTIDLNGGTCVENVIIERDRVTLKNGTVNGTAAVQPVIHILGARGIIIDSMTVQGGASHGVLAVNNADVKIVNSTVQNNAEDGVHLNSEAFGDISFSMIHGNTNCAVSPREAASVLLTNNPLITTAQPNIGICATIGAYRKGLAGDILLSRATSTAVERAPLCGLGPNRGILHTVILDRARKSL